MSLHRDKGDVVTVQPSLPRYIRYAWMGSTPSGIFADDIAEVSDIVVRTMLPYAVLPFQVGASSSIYRYRYR